MKKKLFSSLLILWIATGYAQQPLYKAKLGDAVSTGFYKIVLPPSVIAKSQAGLADIRLVDKKGQQVPYILKADNPVFKESKFIQFPIVSVKREPDQLTHIILRNSGHRVLKELLLIIGNTDANRTIALSGSNDSIHWYVIRENISIENFYQQDNQFIMPVGVSPTEYGFYKIIINGKNLLPVNVLKAGIYEEAITNGIYQELPSPVFNTDTVAKTTRVSIMFNDNYLVNQLKLEVEGLHYYKRMASIFSETGKNDVFLGSFSISSQEPIVFPVNVKGNALRLEIADMDNLPLSIKKVSGFQLNKYLLAYLEAGDSYVLTFGDSGSTTPQYDLAFFSDSVGRDIPALPVGVLERTFPKSNGTAGPPADRTILLWFIIGAVLIALLIFTLRMAGEVNKKQLP